MDNGIKLQTCRPPVGPTDYTRLDPLVPKLAHFFGNCFMPCLGLGIIKHSSFAVVDLQLHIIHYHLHIVIHPPFSFFFLLPSSTITSTLPCFFFLSTLLLYHHHHSKQYHLGLHVITSGQNIIFHSLWASYKRKIFRFQS